MIQVFAEFWRPFLYSDGMRASGLVITLWLLALSIALGFCAAVPLACARVSKKRWLSSPVRVYTYVFRSTPLYVQLLLLYTRHVQPGIRAHAIAARSVLQERLQLRDPRLCAEHLRVHDGDFRRRDPRHSAR